MRAPWLPPKTSSDRPVLRQPEAARRASSRGDRRASATGSAGRRRAPSPLAAVDRVREEDALRERRGEPVREPEVRVGLGQRGRDPRAATRRAPSARRRSRRRRARRRAGAARGCARQATRRRRRERRARAASCEPGPAREARDAEGVERVARAQERAAPRRDPATRRTSLPLRARAALPPLRATAATCPTVPPAAIRHRSCLCSAMATGDVKEDPDRQERDDEARAAVGDERQRNPGQRREPEDGGEVDRRLPADERRDARRRAAFRRDPCSAMREPEPRVGEARSRRRSARASADEAELLADHREDHVGVRLGQVVDLVDALRRARGRRRRPSRG